MCPLLGSDDSPTLLGSDDTPTLLGSDDSPTLLGSDDSPTLLGSDDSGRTALHWAAVCGLVPALPLLLDAAKASHTKRMEAYQVDIQAMTAMGIDPPPPPKAPTPLPEIQARD